MARIVRYTIAGMLGAVIAWALMEWTPLMPDTDVPVPYSYLFVIGLVSGMLIGLAMGIAEGVSGLSPRDAARSVLMGAMVGAAGGVIGITIGNAVYNVFYGVAGPSIQGAALPSDIPAEARPPGLGGPLAFILLLLGRGFGWALIGGFIGVSQGIATSSSKRMANGAIGGFIGGGAGGTVFEILAWMNRGGVANFPPEMVRFISLAITGAAIGLVIGLVEEVAKQAWLIRLVGRNEGKEYVIYKATTVIGRSEFADIPVFQDPDVAAEHARITTQGRRHTIQDMGSNFGTSVNGQVISQHEILKDGDQIVVGKTRFLFRDKATARSYAAPHAYTAGPQIPPVGGPVCPFCGQAKDAAGNCGCTVGAAAPPSQATVQQTVQQPAPNAVTTPISVPTVQPDAPGVGPRLVAVAGPFQGHTFVLKSGETHIGRDASKDIALSADNTVSRDHARISREVTCFAIYDVGSTNGTFVNNQKITQHNLADGDLIQIGSSKFRFEQ